MPPVAGTLPDMKADTESFVKLQTIYREKARQDVAHVRSRVSGLLSALALPLDRVPDQQIEAFCKNVQFIRAIRFTSLQEEYKPSRGSFQRLGTRSACRLTRVYC